MVIDLAKNEKQKKQLAKNIKQMAIPDSANKIADEVIELMLKKV
jgi:UDP-N-acetylglucosamine:LPS N-acetylglucosamine transferase